MKNMVTTEEALKELISGVPDEVLSEAIGGMSTRSRDRLIKLGLVAAVAAAGYGGYRWYTKCGAGKGQPAAQPSVQPATSSPMVGSSESDTESGLPEGCKTTVDTMRKQKTLRATGYPNARVYIDKGGRQHIEY